jgi:hypothetical protein
MAWCVSESNWVRLPQRCGSLIIATVCAVPGVGDMPHRIGAFAPHGAVPATFIFADLGHNFNQINGLVALARPLRGWHAVCKQHGMQQPLLDMEPL